MADWTPNDIPDMNERVVVITGANIGLGYESAVMLAGRGATVIMAVRTITKGQDAAAAIRAQHPDAQVAVMRLDLADLSSVRQFAQDFKAQYTRLDILLNNAGVMATPQQTTQDGFELQFGTNHLGHFALTGLLLDRLLATPDSRVVNVSSLAAERGAMAWDNLMYTDDYARFDVYSQSKLANLLFTVALQQRFEQVGAQSMAVAAHPGIAATNLISGMRIPVVASLIKGISALITPSAAQGAESQVRAAVDPAVQGSDYYGPAGQMRGDATKVDMPPQVNMDDAERLWRASEELTGVTYEFGVAAPAAEA